jgi:hypothetical protein
LGGSSSGGVYEVEKYGVMASASLGWGGAGESSGVSGASGAGAFTDSVLSANANRSTAVRHTLQSLCRGAEFLKFFNDEHEGGSSRSPKIIAFILLP